MCDAPSAVNVPFDQINALLGKVAQLKSTGQGTTVITLDSLGLGSPEFSGQQFYPSPSQLGPNAGLTADELAYLIWFYRNRMVPILQYRDVYDFQRTFGALVQGAMQAKASFSGASIGSTLFVREVRPETVYANTSGASGTAIHNWQSTSVAAGWNAAFFTINLNNTSTTPSANTANNVAALVFGIAELDGSRNIVAHRWADQLGNGQGVDQTTEAQLQASSGLIPGIRAYYIDKNQTWKVDVNFQSAGTYSPALVGVEFVTPALWNSE